MQDVAVVGLDLAKRFFHVVGMDGRGKVVLRRRCTRSQLFGLFEKLPKVRVGMEACGSAHFFGRRLSELGHDARLIPAQFVKPFLKSQKNDDLDAEAIAEAVQRPRMRFVPIKTPEQLEPQAIHRVRDRLVARRTSVSNQIRGLLAEHGISIRKGRGGFKEFVPTLLASRDPRLSVRMRRLIATLWAEWCSTDEAVDRLTTELERIAAHDEACQRLITVPGVGPLVATAMVAAVSDGTAFESRQAFCRLARACAQATDDRGKDQARRDNKARQYIPPTALHPWRPQLPDQRPAPGSQTRRMAERTRDPRPQKCRDSRTRQQAGAHRMVGAHTRHTLQDSRDRDLVARLLLSR